MGFRTVRVQGRAKLDTSLNYLVCRKDTEVRIFLDEIDTLIIESTAVSLTTALISELSKRNVNVIFSDEKHMPQAQLMGLHGNFHSSRRILSQIGWKEKTKGLVWQSIVKQKIMAQSGVLKKFASPKAECLAAFAEQVEENDCSNREGHAAKVYFHELFEGESRRAPTFYNGALNYGYAILLSSVARELTAAGYVSELGIFHRNEFNHYNLACDIMEPFRPIADEAVLKLGEGDYEFKRKLAQLPLCKIKIEGKRRYLNDAICLFVGGVMNALNHDDLSELRFVEEYELPIYENFSAV